MLLAGPCSLAGDTPSADADSSPGWLGVWLGDAVDGGVQVVAVAPRGPAARGGVRGGDVLLQANGRHLGGRSTLESILERTRAGDPVSFIVLRGGSKQSLEVVLGDRDSRDWSLARPPAPPEAAERPEWVSAVGSVPSPPGRWQTGVRVADVTPMLRRHYSAPEDAGVLVVSVDPGTLAQRAGIQVGDMVVFLAGEKVHSGEEFREALRRWNSAEPLPVRLVREGQTRNVEFRLAPEPAPGQQTAAEALRSYREKMIRVEIERLERRINELRAELEQLSGTR